MKRKQLTYEDRLFIQQQLESNLSLHRIAAALHKSDSTISREIIRNRYPVKKNLRHYTPCKRESMCNVANMCALECSRTSCTNCAEICGSSRCPDYTPVYCPRIEKAPHCCNGCPQWPSRACNLVKFRYDAKRAQIVTDEKRSESRKGACLLPEEMTYLDNLVSPMVVNGQSVYAVFREHGESIPCSQRTLYHYIDRCYLTARNLDLPRKVRYKTKYRRKRAARDYDEFALGRTYRDFTLYLGEHPEASVVEMDTVIGKPGGKCLLTLYFRSCGLMLAYLLEQDTQDCVVNALNSLYEAVGRKKFRKLFEVILTDRGPEFRNTFGIEYDEECQERTKVFYCDPYCSWQKGGIERNHEFIRMVLPKKTSFDWMTQEDVILLMNHINSYPRKQRNDCTPFQLAETLLGRVFLRELGLEEVPLRKVQLRPALLNRQKKAAHLKALEQADAY